MKTKIIIIVSLIFLFFGFARILRTAYVKSATYDEAFYLAYGYSFIKTGDFRMAIDKPPLIPMLAALPLLQLKPELNLKDTDWQALKGVLGKQSREAGQALNSWKTSSDPWKFSPYRWNFSLKFLYSNNVDADIMLFSARSVFALLFVVFGLIIFYLLYSLYGIETAGFFTFLWSFSPNILANASLAAEDFTAASLIFISTLYFVYLTKNQSYKASVVFGLLLGFCLISKYTAILIIPVIIVLAVPFDKVRIKYLAVSILVACAVILSFYRFTEIPFYVKGFINTLAYQKRGQAGFCWGKYSLTGFWYYYLVVILFKTPLPLLISIPFIFSKKINRQIKFLCAVPALLILAASSANKIQLGLRYILPLYPFFFLLAASLFSGFSKKLKVISFVLCAWFAYSSVTIHPDYLAYFNEIAGGPANGHKYLVDSNVDWGQDLKTLKKYIKDNKVSDVILSYYGACLPRYAGFEFQDILSFGIWGEKNHINSEKPSCEIIAVSVTNLKGLYFGRIGQDYFRWLENRKPDAMPGYSIYVYDITGDAAAHEWLAHSYYVVGDYEKALRECRRTIEINRTTRQSAGSTGAAKSGGIARLISAFIAAEKGGWRNAETGYNAALKIYPALELPYNELITTRVSQDAYMRGFSLLARYFQSRNRKKDFDIITKSIKNIY